MRSMWFNDGGVWATQNTVLYMYKWCDLGMKANDVRLIVLEGAYGKGGIMNEVAGSWS